MKRTSFAIASAAAALFVSGAHAGESDVSAGPEGAKVKCEGVNGCKGHSACQTAENECSGLNSCKGKGFLKLTKAECDAAKAKLEADS